MCSEAFPTCNWFNFPALLLLSLNGIRHMLPLCLCFVSLNPAKKRSVWSKAYAARWRGQTLHMCSLKLSALSGLAGITVSPSLKWRPSISTTEKGFSVESCLISAFMLWPMCLAQTTWKPSVWLHGGGMKEHLRWTLWPMSSGVITGRDGRDGTAAESTDRGLKKWS